MKLQLVFSFLMFIFFSPVLPAAHAQENKDTHLITEKKFKRLMKKEGIVVIDVRTLDEFSAGHIPGALHVDVQKEDFSNYIQALDPSKKYLLYCKSGKRSAKAKAILKDNEFKEVRHLKGGIQAWTGKLNEE
ncbi:MAG: rhodanese-like domain-containing protein [Chitinophagaceae bacterium]